MISLNYPKKFFYSRLREGRNRRSILLTTDSRYMDLTEDLYIVRSIRKMIITPSFEYIQPLGFAGNFFILPL